MHKQQVAAMHKAVRPSAADPAQLPPVVRIRHMKHWPAASNTFVQHTRSALHQKAGWSRRVQSVGNRAWLLGERWRQHQSAAPNLTIAQHPLTPAARLLHAQCAPLRLQGSRTVLNAGRVLESTSHRQSARGCCAECCRRCMLVLLSSLLVQVQAAPTSLSRWFLGPRWAMSGGRITCLRQGQGL